MCNLYFITVTVLPHIVVQRCCYYTSADLQHTLQTPPVSLDYSQNPVQDLIHSPPPPREQQEPHTPL